MLLQSNRLKRNKDIQKVLEKGKGFKEDFLILKVLPNNLKEIRCAFIVSRRFAKKAILRNKMKRKLRELIRLRLEKIKKGIDIILIAAPSLESKDFWEIEETLERLLNKARILMQVPNNKRQEIKYD